MASLPLVHDHKNIRGHGQTLDPFVPLLSFSSFSSLSFSPIIRSYQFLFILSLLHYLPSGSFLLSSSSVFVCGSFFFLSPPFYIPLCSLSLAQHFPLSIFLPPLFVSHISSRISVSPYLSSTANLYSSRFSHILFFLPSLLLRPIHNLS